MGRYGSTKTPFGFAGQWGYQSDTSGLQLLGHRYYDPSIGRFLTPDPAQDGDNWYAYVDNNPLTGVDPEGLQIGRIIGEILKRLARRGIGKTPKLGKPPFPKPVGIPPKPGNMSTNEFGKGVVRWGDGPQGAKDRLRGLTREDIQGMKDRGLTKEMAEQWRDWYRDQGKYFRDLPRKGDVDTPTQREKLMDEIARRWPKG